MTVSAFVFDCRLVGWHRHGTRWVWGVAEHDGCDLCDAVFAFHHPKIVQTFRVTAAMLTAIGLGPRSRPILPPPPTVTHAVVLQADNHNQTPIEALATHCKAATPLIVDDEIDDTIQPGIESSLPTVPVFSLTHPTADTLRKKRKKR